MMKFNRLPGRCLKSVALALAALLALPGCVDRDDTVGGNLVPDDQQMKAGYVTLPKLDGEKLKYVESRLFQTDSLKASNLAYGYFGAELNDTLGARTMGFLTQIINYFDVPKGYFGHKPVFDSVQLVLSVKSMGRDTLTPQEYYIYEIVDNKYLTERKDTTFYWSDKFDPVKEGIVAKQPLFSFTFPTEKIKNIASASVTLKVEEAGRDFIDRLMLQKGKYKDDYSIYSRDSLKEWVDEFKGIYIVPQGEQTQAGKGAIYSTELLTSSLSFFARNRQPEDESLIKDTIGMVYTFYDNLSTEHGNVSVNTIRRDYTKGTSPVRIVKEEIAESNPDRPLSPHVVVEGFGGVVTELKLSQEFFSALDDIIAAENAQGKNNYSTLAFAKARMEIYFPESDYDWRNIDPTDAVSLVLSMNAALPRLGLYTNYKTLVGVSDYAYRYEHDYSAKLDYGGYINRSRGSYTFDISAQIQGAWNEYVKEKAAAEQENRAVDLDNVKSRVFYLGPEAYALNTPSFSVLQGMATDTGGGQQNNAPIKFELAYNLIK